MSLAEKNGGGKRVEIEFGLFSDIYVVMEGFCSRHADGSNNGNVA